MTREQKQPNRLINEKSPYLLQHAYNPVDWYPWGDEAIKKARHEDKPIFLSIGYSTCYWCHVMEREVFENPEIAHLMSENLVCIKVDREERPDIDRVYMAALQAMTGSGGWPMSMFLTPDLKPFYGGTYIPPITSYGRPGFPDIIRQIMKLWKTDREKLVLTGDEVAKYLKSTVEKSASPGDPEEMTESAQRVFEKSYDRLHGGFGSAPKFPRPIALEFLLRHYHRTRNASVLGMVLETLRQMARGGIYDQIGGGFHRYAVDAEWRVPHFEKMLYDQAQLSILYTEAYQITHDDFYKQISTEILTYVTTSLTDPEGGFYSAEDAESATDPGRPDIKKEGAFYLWTNEEIDQILGDRQGEIFRCAFGVSENGNVQYDPKNEFTGKNILYRAHTPEETAQQFSVPLPDVKGLLDLANKKLLNVRSQRPRPHLDDKIITAWNGLMISAFAKAYQVFAVPKFLITAERAAEFAHSHLYDGATLYRRYRDHDRRFEGTLQDYAFLAAGFIDLYEADFRVSWLEKAIELTERQHQLFRDEKNAGFFDITANDKTILLRTKESYDGAEPSGNSIATQNLLRLGLFTGNTRWQELARQNIDLFSGSLHKYPETMPGMLTAMEWLLSTSREIVIVGEQNENGTDRLLREVRDHFLPNTILILKNHDAGSSHILQSLPYLEGMQMTGDQATAYVCQNYACQMPTSDPVLLGKMLSGDAQPSSRP